MSNRVQGARARAFADALQSFCKTMAKQRSERVWQRIETRPLNPAKIGAHGHMDLIVKRRRGRFRRSANANMRNRRIAQERPQYPRAANGIADPKWLGKN